MTRPGVGPSEPWRGFRPRELHAAVDPEAFNADTRRGAVWRFAEVGHPVEGYLEVVAICLLALGVVVGFPLEIAVALIAVALIIAGYNHGHAIRWAEEHNARVEQALGLEPGSLAPPAATPPAEPDPAAKKRAKPIKPRSKR